MAIGRDKAQWRPAASIIVEIRNQNLPKGKPPYRAEDVSPYGGKLGSTSGNKVPLRASNLHILKAFT